MRGIRNGLPSSCPIATGPITLPGSSRTSPPISSAISSTGKSLSPSTSSNSGATRRSAAAGWQIADFSSRRTHRTTSASMTSTICRCGPTFRGPDITRADLLRMWCVYSWTRNPARLSWHGLSMRENWETFFGAVSLLDKSVFTAVNGFPNCYWGWGPEDLEMSNRLRLRGYKLERRDGTFIPLPHKHAGYTAPHEFNDVGRRTNALFAKREPDFEKLIAQDGVGTLKFRLVEKKLLALPSTPALPKVFHYIVDLGEPEPGAV